jgi:hypothetical protein
MERMDTIGWTAQVQGHPDSGRGFPGDDMFEGIDRHHILNMSERERRWLDNVKKAFHASDRGFQDGAPEDHCLEELFKAIDTAKTLRRSLRGENASNHDNRKRFIEFLALEIPAADPHAAKYDLRQAGTNALVQLSLGEILYEIRCKIHENENLNYEEAVDYHILVDWSDPTGYYPGRIDGGKFICNGFFLWKRLRQVLSKFITGIEAAAACAQQQGFSMTISPELGSIRPSRKRRPS